MENASKALLIAGSVMLTMLVVSLLLYAWTSVSEYQAEQQKLIEIQELAEFNQQFTNYERDDVQGYELLSLVNKVIDYNQRFSDEGTITTSTSVAGNIAQYKPIEITIIVWGNGSDVTKDELKGKFSTTMKVPKENGNRIR